MKGGIIKRLSPHYMVIGHSPWLSTWHENSAYIGKHGPERYIEAHVWSYDTINKYCY